jgi:hypothetical protein
LLSLIPFEKIETTTNDSITNNLKETEFRPWTMGTKVENMLGSYEKILMSLDRSILNLSEDTRIFTLIGSTTAPRRSV